MIRFMHFDVGVPMRHEVTRGDEELLHRLLLVVPQRLDVAVQDIPEHEWRGVIRPQVVRTAHEGGPAQGEREALRLVASFVVVNDSEFSSKQVDKCLDHLRKLKNPASPSAARRK